MLNVTYFRIVQWKAQVEYIGIGNTNASLVFTGRLVRKLLVYRQQYLHCLNYNVLHPILYMYVYTGFYTVMYITQCNVMYTITILYTILYTDLQVNIVQYILVYTVIGSLNIMADYRAVLSTLYSRH